MACFAHNRTIRQDCWENRRTPASPEGSLAFRNSARMVAQMESRSISAKAIAYRSQRVIQASKAIPFIDRLIMLRRLPNRASYELACLDM